MLTSILESISNRLWGRNHSNLGVQNRPQHAVTVQVKNEKLAKMDKRVADIANKDAEMSQSMKEIQKMRNLMSDNAQQHIDDVVFGDDNDLLDEHDPTSSVDAMAKKKAARKEKLAKEKSMLERAGTLGDIKKMSLDFEPDADRFSYSGGSPKSHRAIDKIVSKTLGELPRLRSVREEDEYSLEMYEMFGDQQMRGIAPGFGKIPSHIEPPSGITGVVQRAHERAQAMAESRTPGSSKAGSRAGSRPGSRQQDNRKKIDQWTSPSLPITGHPPLPEVGSTKADDKSGKVLIPGLRATGDPWTAGAFLSPRAEGPDNVGSPRPHDYQRQRLLSPGQKRGSVKKKKSEPWNPSHGRLGAGGFPQDPTGPPVQTPFSRVMKAEYRKEEAEEEMRQVKWDRLINASPVGKWQPPKRRPDGPNSGPGALKRGKMKKK